MAQTSSAAREPSMEEILASIRRIIEDSDVTRQPAPMASQVRGEVAEFRRPVTEQPVAQPERPAMMRNVFQDEPTLRGPIGEPVPPAPEPAIEAEDEDEVVLNAENDDHSNPEPLAHPQQPVATDISLEEMDLSVEAEIAKAVDTLLEPEPDAEIEQEVPVQSKAAAPVTEAVAKPQPSAHMLSQIAERQVAAAFQDLNHAVRAEPRRSFDDIAAELLRPMLQDWLDNNLPTLVERLVREEIERVVRGER
ncbi:PopZ family protein [Brucella intermedia]|uniref:PopZ family protein n=1 Tax=Brucella intermedia TaxID=94625 RepID=UPI0023623219|nr:PopZ family protein [Brucella intermedia]